MVKRLSRIMPWYTALGFKTWYTAVAAAASLYVGAFAVGYKIGEIMFEPVCIKIGKKIVYQRAFNKYHTDAINILAKKIKDLEEKVNN
uniref:Uncharacterized protein n=1 Tax=Panagrolaimus davidi TaxID=227884 RepID=A0A914PAP1_9BILA